MNKAQMSMNNFCFDSCLLHVCIQIHFQPLKGQNRVAFRELETSNLIFTTTSCWETKNNNNNIADWESAGPNQESVAAPMMEVMGTQNVLGVADVSGESRQSPEVSKERVLLLVSSGLNIYLYFLHRHKKDHTKWHFGNSTHYTRSLQHPSKVDEDEDYKSRSSRSLRLGTVQGSIRTVLLPLRSKEWTQKVPFLLLRSQERGMKE